MNKIGPSRQNRGGKLRLRWVTTALVLVPALLGAQVPEPTAAADEPAASAKLLVDSASLNGDASSTGRVAVNVAAGTNNQQANVGVIAIGGTALGFGSVAQRLPSVGPARESAKSAVIEDNAFAGSSGMIAVNVAAGTDNQQVNLAVVALGLTGPAINDRALSQSRASSAPADTNLQSEAPGATTTMGTNAFAQASGLTQINLVAGDRNSTANVFGLTVSDSSKP